MKTFLWAPQGPCVLGTEPALLREEVGSVLERLRKSAVRGAQTPASACQRTPFSRINPGSPPLQADSLQSELPGKLCVGLGSGRRQPWV